MQLKFDSDYIINEEVRQLIQSNDGELIDPLSLKETDFSNLFAVGDFTCKILEENGIFPKIEVYDLRTQRGKETYSGKEGSRKVRNAPGVVSGELIEEVSRAILSHDRTNIEVEGEEDLAVLPIIFYAPIHSLVVYGIPDEGMAVIHIEGKTKELVEKIFDKMEVKKHEL